MPSSTRAYARSGEAVRQRALHAPPTASPAMNVDSTTATASVVFPNTSPNERSQSDS
jgi:hypothetical protein